MGAKDIFVDWHKLEKEEYYCIFEYLMFTYLYCLSTSETSDSIWCLVFWSDFVEAVEGRQNELQVSPLYLFILSFISMKT